MLDSNTYELNKYLYDQEMAEKDWEMNKEENMQKVVDLACKIILQEVDNKTFHWVFSAILDGSYDEEINVDNNNDSLDRLVEALELFEYKQAIDHSVAWTIVGEAVDGACELLFNDDIYNTFDVTYDDMFAAVLKQLGVDVI